MFVDDSKFLAALDKEEDVEELQNNLDHIYEWGDVYHMKWNQLKFQMIRMGSNEELESTVSLLITMG